MWFVHSIYGYDVFGSAFLSLRQLIEFFTFFVGNFILYKLI